MRLYPTENFKRDYAHLPKDLQKRADKKLALLLANPRHPSLQTKKMEGHHDLWEGRISQGCRFIFRIVGDTYLLLNIGPHDIERRPG
jgi:mRNA-degrading endonuclease RelE of RelBE toxin-antitoxin system